MFIKINGIDKMNETAINNINDIICKELKITKENIQYFPFVSDFIIEEEIEFQLTENDVCFDNYDSKLYDKYFEEAVNNLDFDYMIDSEFIINTIQESINTVNERESIDEEK